MLSVAFTALFKHVSVTVSLLCRRSWCPRSRRCARRSWRASTCHALLPLPLLCHLLPSYPLPWCPLSTQCLLSTHLAPWVACHHIITHIIHITRRSTDPEPSQVSEMFSPQRHCEALLVVFRCALQTWAAQFYSTYCCSRWTTNTTPDTLFLSLCKTLPQRQVIGPLTTRTILLLGHYIVSGGVKMWDTLLQPST